MNEYNFNVKFEKGRISSNLKKLVQNDYNSTKINFTFDKEGRKLFKMLYPDGSAYIAQIDNDELLFGPGVLSQDGIYEVEIALYTEDGRLTDYATTKFDVRAELIQSDEIIELDDRLPILDSLIGDVNKIKEDAENGVFDGEDGKSGVYVGTEEPTDPDVNIWINPDGEGTDEIATKEYVDEAIKNISGGGTSEGGTTNYLLLENKPKINNVELYGSKTLNDLGIQAKGNYALVDDIPTKISQLNNDSNYLTSIPTEYVTDTELQEKGYATENYVKNEIANAQLGGGDVEIDLSGYATKDELAGKVDKVIGKSLIADSEIERLASVTNYDDTSIKNTLNSKANLSDIPTKLSELTNDEGFITGYTETDPTVPSHVKAITSSDISNWNNKSTFSGSYNDLSNKPTIPNKTSQLTNDSNFISTIPSEYITETELNDAISNLNGGTGNVSSDTINSIMVVDELPETEVEGVLYLVKETTVTPEEPEEPVDGNLYNYSTATVFENARLSGSDNKLKSSEGNYSTYVQVEPSTTYKVSKTLGATFRLGTTTEVPVIGSSITQYKYTETDESINITLGESDKYIVITHYNTNDTITEEEMRKSIVVTKVA